MTDTNQFNPEVLLVFIGHSDDANHEARAIQELELDLGRELDRLQVAANGALPFKTARCWEWTYDAGPQVGGQDATVTPVLDRANIALFVFKERVGKVTWSELERSRSRSNPAIPVVAFFPLKPPSGLPFSDLAAVEAWADLLRKRTSLTEDWQGPNSKSLRPTRNYIAVEDLKQIVLEQIKGALDAVLRSLPPKIEVALQTSINRTFLGKNPDLTCDRRPVLIHSAEELDGLLVKRFLERPLSREQLMRTGLDPENLEASLLDRLTALGCITDGRPTLGAFLCFAPEPLLINKLDGCSLQMVSYDHSRKASSSPSISTAQGNLLSLYDEGMAWLTRGAALRRQGRIGSEERDELEIPEIVLREALANALVHRDYETDQLKEQPTRLEVFPDRIEIASFGNLPDAVPVELLNSDSDGIAPWRRNPLIAKIFQYMGRMELNASGVSRMRAEMEKSSLAFPKFISDTQKGVLRVVLLRPASNTTEPSVFLPTGLLSMASQDRRQPLAMISSSAIELKEHRKQAVEACLRLGFTPTFVDELPVTLDVVDGMIDRADVFIAIYGWRYGWIPEGMGVSISEIEFNRVAERGIPVLVFIMHEDHPVTRAMIEERNIPPERLGEFKSRVKESFAAVEFKSPEDLRVQILHRLTTLVQKGELLYESRRREIATELASSEQGKEHTEPYWSDALRVYGEGFAGRHEELAELDRSWRDGVRVFVLHAEGGAGKTRVVAQWLRLMMDDGWRGAGRVFVHSFYSQGNNDGRTASAELFFDNALSYFGYAGSRLRDPNEKGRSLARLLVEKSGLLVLDGMEPFQHAPSFEQGRLKDPGLRSLLLSLSGRTVDPTSLQISGLCVITSRQPIVELYDKDGHKVIQHQLDRLDAAAGEELLRQLEVRGPERELRQAVEDSRGHAYSLMLLGTYLRDATDDHEIRRRHEIPLLAEDSEHRYHARHLFGSYIRLLGESSPEIALLRLLGFFDRPVHENVLVVLSEAPETDLHVLTEPLRNLSASDWRRIFRRLSVLRLIDLPTTPLSPIDSHALLREYFGEHLRTHFREAWRTGHRKLFEYFCNSTEYRPNSIGGLTPLYQAVVHGCMAGMHEKALHDVYRNRILRDTELYSIANLGSIGADLRAVACFFETPWTTPSPNLTVVDQAWLLSVVALCLRAIGRLVEAVGPMRVGLEMSVKEEDFQQSALRASNLSELELTRGNISAAITTGEESIGYANRSGSSDWQLFIVSSTTLANALHQAGRRDESRRLFEDAESRQTSPQPANSPLYSLAGFQYCDLLLSDAERAAWQCCLAVPVTTSFAACDPVNERATNALRKSEGEEILLDIALDHLTLARATLYNAVSLSHYPQPVNGHIAASVDAFRESGRTDYLPLGLLTRAWLRCLSGDETGCREDLDEAWEIAERGPMPLFMADIQFYRARLFRDRAALSEARRLIEKHGYYRRYRELADADVAAERWAPTRVFISYSHDSEHHSQRVLALANQLRQHGVEVELDQYETRPPQGWSRWCEEQLRPENSDYVLVICTETYLMRIEGRVSAEEGLGVFWEGDVIYNYLYDQKDNSRFIPIVFDHGDETYIPRPLKGATRYRLGTFSLSDNGYRSLYRELTQQPVIQIPPLGEVISLRSEDGLSRRGGDDVMILPPVEPREVRSTPETDMLEELRRLPRPWFDELVFLFDTNSAVSAKSASQAMRAIDLLTLVQVHEDGLARLREEIQRLKWNRR